MKLPEATTAVATSTAAAGALTVRLNGVFVTVLVARDLTVAVNDIVLLVRLQDRYVAVCRLFAAAVTDPDEEFDQPDPNTALVSGELVILPVYTGTYRDAVWLSSTDDTMQGAYGGAGNATGAAYYGDKPATLAGATATSATVRLTRLGGGFAGPAATTLALLQGTDVGGPPVVLATTAGPTLSLSDLEDFAVPAAWAQQLVDGTAGGLGLFDADGVPFARLAGRTADPAAWKLSIFWERNS